MSGFTFRAARPVDREALRAIAAKTWDGTDYLPRVMDEWLADRAGAFLVALLDGRVVGCGKLTFLTPVDAWLEGLRKDPDVREKGMAVAMAGELLRLAARRPDLASVRFCTYVKNHPSRTANERLGFRVRVALSVKEWSGKRDRMVGLPGYGDARRGGLPSEAPGVEPIRDPGLARHYVEASGWFEAAGGICAEGWRAYPWSWELFQHRYLDAGCCLGLVDDGRLRGLIAFRSDTHSPSTSLKLVFLDAADRQAADLLLDALFARGAAQGREELTIECMVPPGNTRARDWLEARGFASWEQEDDFLVYELPRELLGSYRA